MDVYKPQQYSDFLKAFPYEKAMLMTLEDYSGIATENDNYFCRWVEFKAKDLGGIRGGSAYKYGIYRVRNDENPPRNGYTENGYAWLKEVGTTFEEASNYVLTNIKKVIQAAHKGRFEEIDGIDGFFDVFKWKVAFLYSEKKLVPIYKVESLRYLAAQHGFEKANVAPISALQHFLIKQKQDEESIWDFGDRLWKQWVKYDERTRYYIARLSYDDKIERAVSENRWITQQRYGIQDGATVTRLLKTIKKIKENDILLLTNGKKIVAAGRTKAFIKENAAHEAKLSKFIENRKHEFFDFNGSVFFSDCPCYYESLSSNSATQDTWEQFVNVEQWDYYNPDSEVTTSGLKRKVRNATVQNTIFEVDTEWGKQKYEELENKEPEPLEDVPEVEYMDELTSLLKKKKNIILQGAPGTGKTYETAELALSVMGDPMAKSENREDLMKRYRELINEKRIAFVTFHQTMDYESFVEGLKAVPVKDENEKVIGGVTYEPKPGIFKIICENARTKKDEDFDSNFDKYLQSIKGIENKKTIPSFSGKFQIDVWYDGGATIQVRSTRSTILDPTKSPSPVNIEKIKNQANGDIEHGENNWPHYANAIIAAVQKEYAPKTDSDKQPYVLIIDEINRGNVSKIFGELITLLEPDKREGEVNEVKAKLTYSQLDFTVPSNLYIIGTMNTTDRSVGTIDYAIRRRFAFKTLEADRSVVQDWDGFKDEDVRERSLKLFDSVKKFLEDNKVDMDIKDMMVGHSYFLAENSVDLDMKWQYEILPLIQEYYKDGIIKTEPKQVSILEFIDPVE